MQRHIFICLLLLSAVIQALAQQGQYRYWIDSSDNLITGTYTGGDVAAAVDLTAYPSGPHLITYMASDAAGRWSAPQTTLFFKEFPAQSPATATALEYWIDNPANRTAIPVAAGQCSATVNTADLKTGFHLLTYRVQDSRGGWSAPQTTLFFKEAPAQSPATATALEYWIDNPANRTTLQVAAGQCSATVNTADMKAGFHLLTYRVQDSRGGWSAPQTTIFIKEAPVKSPALISAYQYWFNAKSDSIVTVELPTPISPYELTAAVAISEEQIDKSRSAVRLITDDNGRSTLYYANALNMRFRDTNGNWSANGGYEFIVEATDAHIDLTNIIVNRDASLDKQGWTFTGSGGTEKKNDHYSGSNRGYFRLGDKNGKEWSASMTQTVNGLPPGTYTLSVASRATLMTDLRLTVNGQSTDLPSKGMTGGDIWSTAADSTAERLTNNGNGAGWSRSTLIFTTNGEPLTITVECKAAESGQWANVTDFELSTDRLATLKVTYADDIDPELYKGMKLLLKADGTSISVTTTARRSYNFPGITAETPYSLYLNNAYGQTLWSKENFKVDEKGTEITIDTIRPMRDIELRAVSADGRDLTAGVKVRWHDRDGNRLADGSRIAGIPDGSVIAYSVQLTDTIGTQYREPSGIMPAFTATDSTSVQILTLQPLSQATLSGRVMADKYPAYKAPVTVTQYINGRYPLTTKAETDSNGRLNIELPDDSCRVAITYAGYINRTVALQRPTDMGDVRLEPISGSQISLNLRMIPRSETETAADTAVWAGSPENLIFTLRNLTTGADSISYILQNRTLIADGLNPGDEIELTARSRNGEFDAAGGTATVSINKTATVSLTFTERGAISLSYTSSANQENQALLFDESGRLVGNTDFSHKGSTAFTGLPAGNYTVAALGKSDLFSLVSGIDALEESGLVEGDDYVTASVTVTDARTATVKLPTVPRLNETALYYTSDATSFTSDKTRTVTGNYVTFTTRLEFKERYATGITDMALVIEIPDGCDYVYNSGIVGDEIASCTLEGNKVIIPLTHDNYRNRVRFCIIPTRSDRYFTHATLQFKHNGEAKNQPLGRLVLDVDELEIKVPVEIQVPEFTVSGQSVPNATVEVFDRDKSLGSVKSRSDGSWTMKCALDNPTNYSKHQIRAEITMSNGTVLYTNTHTLSYNINANRVSTVKMINTAHGPRDLKPLEYTCVFDFIDPMSVEDENIYWYWPKYPDFTFIVDFLDNNPERVSNVIVKAHTTSGNVVPLKATYSAKENRWIATGKFTSHSLPVNVSVAYDYEDPDMVIDQRAIDNVFNNTKKTGRYFIDNKNRYDSIALRSDSLDKANPDGIEWNILEQFWNEAGLLPINADRTIPLPAEIQTHTDKFNDATTIAELDSYLNDAINELNRLYPSFSNIEPAFAVMYDLSEGRTVVRNDQHLKMGFNAPLVIEADTTGCIDIITKSTTGGTIRQIASPNLYILRDETNRNHLMMWEAADNRSKAQHVTAGGSNFDNVNDIASEDNSDTGAVTEDDFNKAKYFAKQILDDYTEARKKINIRGRYPKEFERLSKGIDLADKFADVLDAAEDIKDLIESTLPPMDFNNNLERHLRNLHAKVNKCKLDEYIDPLLPSMTLSMTIYRDEVTISTGALHYLDNGWNRFADGIDGFIRLIGLGSNIQRMNLSLGAYNYYKNLSMEINLRFYRKIPWDRCDDDEPDELPDPAKWEIYSGLWVAKPLIDPSGYVYEAVTSNRLEGVTATIYELTTSTDMYGESSQTATAWNAEMYSQQNPQITDQWGMYQWDVPAGQWQVRFSKPGYEPTATKWLPVPPPQLDINIPMTQATNPTVENAVGYESGITVTFDKYMIPATVADTTITVSRRASGAVEGSLQLVNLEEDPYTGESFASKVKFVPSRPFTAGETVTLHVSRGSRSYADMPMLDDYEAQIVIQNELTAIEADTLVEMTIGETRSVEIAVLPASAAAGRTLTIDNGSPSIATVQAEKIRLDDNGRATIGISGLLPGGSPLKFGVEGSDISHEMTVDVGFDIDVAARPTASIPTGTIVDPGTPVALYCSTEGATIYYTTDGSCPCDEATRIRYAGPIIIDRTMTIKAQAMKTGADPSDVATFEYTMSIAGLGETVAPSDNVFTDNGEILITGCNGTDCSIYDIDGKVVWASRKLSGDIRVRLARNHAYIVRLMTKDGKVTVNRLML